MAIRRRPLLCVFTAAAIALLTPAGAPAQNEEFVLYHSDNIQATGFLEHIKLPHYVDFQSELELIRKLRREAGVQDVQEAAE